MNIKEFDEFVEMWDEEGQPPDVDWLEYAQDFRNQTQQLEVDNAALKQALTLIGDIGYDYDGYRTPHDLKKLIDEMVGYARNPQSAVDTLTAEEQEDEQT